MPQKSSANEYVNISLLIKYMPSIFFKKITFTEMKLKAKFQQPFPILLQTQTSNLDCVKKKI